MGTVPEEPGSAPGVDGRAVLGRRVPTARATAAGPALVRHLGRHAGNAATTARLVGRDAQISGNPDDLEKDGKKPGTVHELPAMADTVGPMDADNLAQPPGVVDTPIKVRPKATKEAPIVRTDTTAPPLTDLWTREGAEAATPATTVEQPAAELAALDGLYIGGQPRAADVQQAMIGDCWDLAVVAAIAARDPGKIAATIVPAGAGIAATFFRSETKATWGVPPWKTVYEPVVVTTSSELAFDADASGHKAARVNGRGTIHGSQLHHAAHAVDKHWWVEQDGSKLIVKSKAFYELARWAPLLEKAFARFAQEYGQYGGTGKDGEQKKGGYKAIDGGFSKDLYTAFYGEQGDADAHPDAVQDASTVFTPGLNVLLDNVPVVKQLLPLQGASEQAEKGEKGDAKAPIVTAGTSTDEMCKRLAQTIDFLRSFEEYEKLVDQWTRRRVGILRASLVARDDAWEGFGKDDRTQEVAAAAAAVVRKDDADSLLASRSDPRMGTAARNVVDLALDVMNAGTDHSTGQRNLYGEHAYTVLSARFADSAGKPVLLPQALPAEREKLIGILGPVGQEASTVRLRNPHGRNEPDERGDGRASRPENGTGEDGLFTMTLAQFILNFADVQSFSAPHSR